AAASPDGNAWVLAKGPRGVGARIAEYRHGTWKTTMIPREGNYPYGPVDFDGNVGVWWDSIHWTGTRLINTESHVQQGRIELANVVPVPHTASAWAPAWAHGQLIRSAIAGYGRP